MFCKTCQQEKDSSYFYLSDKHHCKDCKKAYARKHREDNIERVREYDRNRPNAKERIIKAKEYKAKMRIEDPEKFDKIFHSARKNYRKNSKEKCQAEGKLDEALRRGKIKRPEECSVCHIKCKPQGHHFDYTKPLDVIWVCPSCHSKIHKELRQKARKAV